MVLRFYDGTIPAAYRNLGNLVRDYEDKVYARKRTLITIKGFSKSMCKVIEKKFFPMYREDPAYKKRLLARMYKLDEWYQSVPLASDRVVTMVTLTSHQRKHPTYMSQYTEISEAYAAWREFVKDRFGSLNYVLIAEPHHSGFLHYHILFFKAFSDSDKEYLTEKWYRCAKTYNWNSIDFSESEYLRSAKNYLMKYILKTLNTESSSDEHFVVFNAVLSLMNSHKTDYKGVRAFQPSFSLNHVMALDLRDYDELQIDWIRVDLSVCGAEFVRFSWDDYSPPYEIDLSVNFD